jgi:hypothetical protein
VALFGIECASGDTFTDGSVNFAMTSIRVPDPVMSVSLTPKSTDQLPNFQRALQRFQREDPTFTVSNNAGRCEEEALLLAVAAAAAAAAAAEAAATSLHAIALMKHSLADAGYGCLSAQFFSQTAIFAS